MRRAIGKHLGDFIAIFVLFVLALGVGGYILSHQRLRFPFVQDKPFVVKVELANAQAVQPGQGQTVRTAGVEIGQIGKVELEDGKAVVEMQLDPEYDKYIREDATVLLRTKTGLKDMFLEVDPGTGDPIPENGRIPSSNTAPDIDPDEVLAALDSDTRDYLQLLVAGAGKGLKGRGSDLQETFARLGPLNRDVAKLTTAVARRRTNLSRLVNRYGRLTQELGTKDKEIVRLVQQSNAVLDAFASEDSEISETVSKLPGALRQTASTLGKVDSLGGELRPALNALRPPFRKLDEANRAVLPFVREAAPQIRDQIRPFARVAGPFTQDLGAASRDLTKAAPSLTASFDKLNRLFNIGAYNAKGAEGLTGDLATDRARDEGYLYHLAWLSQNTVSLFSTSNASGPQRRLYLGGLSCSTIRANLGVPEPVASAVAVRLGPPPGGAGVCTGTPTAGPPTLGLPIP